MASVSGDDRQRRSHLHLDSARVDPDEQLVPTEEIYVTLDSPTTKTRNRRRPALVAAAALVVLGVAAIAFAVNNTSSSDDDAPPSATAVTVAPSTTVAATAAPTTIAATTVAPTTAVAAITKTVQFTVTNAHIPVTFTVPNDWTVAEGFTAYNGTDVGVLFDDVTNIYADGCAWKLVDPPVGPTVDDLVAAWADVPDLAPTAAVDITVNGHTGKQIELTVPDYASGECRANQFGLWRVPSDPSESSDSPGYWAQGPKQHLKTWVLDIDGTRLVIAWTYLPSASPQERAALDAASASFQIG